MLGFSVRAIDDCGAFPRYEPLGCIIWAQVTPGCYRWRNVRVDFTQVCTNKSPVAPNRGYSRMQHLWLTERIVDIVAGELGLDPVEVRKQNYVKHEEFPYETPNGCIYDSGDYARVLDIALDLTGYDSLEEKRRDAESRGKLFGIGIGSTLDSGTNNFGQSMILNPELQFSGNNEVATVKLDIFGEVVVTLGTVPQGQGHETTAAQVVADALGISPDDVTVRPGHDTYWNSHAGFSGTYASQFAVTGLGAVKAAVDDCGNRIHPQIVEGQVHGATAQALGAATHETFTYDEQGNLLTPNFYDYHVPHALDMPPLKTGYIESPSPFTSLGAKGMGEGGGAGIHAVCAALQDALRPVGNPIVYDSCNPPHRVWELISNPAESRGRISVESR